MEMSVEAEVIWLRILKQLEVMRMEIRREQQHTPGTRKNV